VGTAARAASAACSALSASARFGGEALGLGGVLGVAAQRGRVAGLGIGGALGGLALRRLGAVTGGAGGVLGGLGGAFGGLGRDAGGFGGRGTRLGLGEAGFGLALAGERLQAGGADTGGALGQHEAVPAPQRAARATPALGPDAARPGGRRRHRRGRSGRGRGGQLRAGRRPWRRAATRLPAREARLHPAAGRAQKRCRRRARLPSPLARAPRPGGPAPPLGTAQGAR
jgi:hypothetical protein